MGDNSKSVESFAAQTEHKIHEWQQNNKQQWLDQIKKSLSLSELDSYFNEHFYYAPKMPVFNCLLTAGEVFGWPQLENIEKTMISTTTNIRYWIQNVLLPALDIDNLVQGIYKKTNYRTEDRIALDTYCSIEYLAKWFFSWMKYHIEDTESRRKYGLDPRTEAPLTLGRQPLCWNLMSASPTLEGINFLRLLLKDNRVIPLRDRIETPEVVSAIDYLLSAIETNDSSCDRFARQAIKAIFKDKANKIIAKAEQVYAKSLPTGDTRDIRTNK